MPPLQMLQWGKGWSRNTWEEPLHTHKSAPSLSFDVDTPISLGSLPGEVAIELKVRGQPALIFEWVCVL